MKNFWKYLVVAVFAFLLVGCDTKPKEDVYYKVYVEVLDQFVKDQYDLPEFYEVKENEYLELPVIPSNESIFISESKSSDGQLEYIMTEYLLKSSTWLNSDGSTIDDSKIQVTKDINISLDSVYSKSEKKVKITLNEGLIENIPSVDGNILLLPTPTKENYVFQGWYSNPNFISNTYESVDFSSFEKQLNLYAKFTIDPEYVISLIDDLPVNPTIENIEEIKIAQASYSRLAKDDKSKVTNYDKLKALYSKIETLEFAKDFYDKITELYKQEVTINLRKDVETIQEMLQLFDEETLSFIPELDLTKLDDIIEQIDAILVLYQEDAKAFDKAVVSIPIFMEQYYSEEIIDLYEQYQSFNDDMKALITSTHKLDRLYQSLNEIENSDSLIYYLNPETTRNVYLSKDQLCEAFFTDFYYYIVAYHGTKHLENNGLNDVYDFVELSQDFTGAGANNLYGIGNIAGRYLLEKDINGILENQTEKAFFGFCYQNNIYQDVLPFFINFFAYWRIDEKYANTSNYGADIFAESWAPTVDIAKFFYYDEFTSYVKTDRMIDCLTNTASVVYGMEDDIFNIRMRGYTFLGWYDNPEFSGNPVTDLDNLKSNKLYAKWAIDEEQKDQDAANLVDVYIYNLTTKKAVVNATTVGYVKDMYNNLSDNAKKLVKNYSTLENFINQYQ